MPWRSTRPAAGRAGASLVRHRSARSQSTQIVKELARAHLALSDQTPERGQRAWGVPPVLRPTPVAFGIGRLASVRRSSSVSRFRSLCPYARVAGAGTLPGTVILAGNYTSKTPNTIAPGTGEAILLP